MQNGQRALGLGNSTCLAPAARALNAGSVICLSLQADRNSAVVQSSDSGVPVHWTGKAETTMYLHISDQIVCVPPGRQLRAVEDHQLLSVLRPLISPVTAERVIARVGLAGIRRLSAADLETSCSISKIAARRIVVARDLAELFMRRATTLGSAAAVMAYLPPGLASLESEVILGFALNAAMAVIGGYLLAKGGGSLVSLTARDVFVPLLRASASAFVLVHNHPSGDPMPSPEDVRFTESIADAAHVLGIAFIDHLIAAQSGITSMLELGLIPTQEHSTTSTVRS